MCERPHLTEQLSRRGCLAKRMKHGHNIACQIPLRSNGSSGSAAHSTPKTSSAPPPTTADSIEYGVTIYPAALDRSAKQWLQSRSSMKIAMLPSTLWVPLKTSAFAASNLFQLKELALRQHVPPVDLHRPEQYCATDTRCGRHLSQSRH